MMRNELLPVICDLKKPEQKSASVDFHLEPLPKTWREYVTTLPESWLVLRYRETGEGAVLPSQEKIFSAFFQLPTISQGEKMLSSLLGNDDSSMILAEKFLSDFYGRYGPLFRAQGLPVDVIMKRIGSLIRLRFWLDEPAVLMEDILKAAGKHPGNSVFTPSYNGFLPAIGLTEGVWPIFKLPKRLLPSRIEQRNWAQSQIAKNAATWFAECLKLESKVIKSTKQVKLLITPYDLFTWLLVRICLADKGKKCKTCGTLIPSGNIYCSQKCRQKGMSTYGKQQILNKLRGRKRVKIPSIRLSATEYEKAKKIVGKLWDLGMTDEEEIFQEVYKRLGREGFIKGCEG
jgi:predicted nucleic acid-binding Zn ribbon protein